jgi:hypothetical protein
MGRWLDVEYFVDNSTKMSFGKLIHDMYDPNPKVWRTIQHVVRTLMGLPYNWITPKKCYWRAIRQFVIVRYGIWCNLHDLSKMTCFGLVDFIKTQFCKRIMLSCVIKFEICESIFFTHLNYGWLDLSLIIFSNKCSHNW